MTPPVARADRATGDCNRLPLVLIPQFFGSLIFDRRNSRYMPFDATCSALLTRLTRTPIGAVLAEAKASGRQSSLTATAIGDFYDYFYRLGYFTADGYLGADVLDLAPPADHLAGPLAVHLEIAATCNLTCTHCFAGPLPRAEPPLSTQELDRLFAELASLGSFRLGLTGGEPLARRDVFDIIDSATDHGLHPCITTNGLLITEDIARAFGRRELVWLNVSLDGADAAHNDAIRGSGTFARVREKLRILGRHARFTLAFTITSTNAHQVRACARLAREVGAHTAVFRPLYPVGIAEHNLHLMPTYRQYAEALASLRAPEWTLSGCDADTGAGPTSARDVRALDPLAIETFGPDERRDTQAKVFRNPGCGAGNLVASVSIQGQVNPCSFLGSSRDAGNIRDRSFAEIWSQSQVFTGMRSLSGEFAGGCRARSATLAGGIDAADPWHTEWYDRQVTDADPPHHPMDNLHVSRSAEQSPNLVHKSARTDARRSRRRVALPILTRSTDESDPDRVEPR